MTLQDLLITPFYFVLFLGLGYLLRNRLTTPATRRYFLPALIARMFGAVMLGVIYQFYYNGGDTFNYFTHGSRWIWEAFLDSPALGIQLLFDPGVTKTAQTFIYTQHIWYYGDPASFFVVRLAALVDLFTFHTYSASALFFAAFSFSGSWAMYSVVQTKYPQATRWLAYGLLFFPSVVFWGSGILKDTITLGALGWMTWALIRWIDLRKRSWREPVMFLLGFWLIYTIKIYIVICFVPMVAVWLFFKNVKAIRSVVVRVLVVPVLLIFFGLIGFLALRQVSADNAKYSLENIAEQARITAYDIRYGWGARTGGDGGYDIGIPDGTVQGMVMLAPAAISVSLFRPYVWEVKNPLMALAALESLLVLWLTVWFLGIKGGWKRVAQDPFLIFCLAFALLFAFAVGVSTANFGTLMRYKIPLVPFFMILLVVAKELAKPTSPLRKK